MAERVRQPLVLNEIAASGLAEHAGRPPREVDETDWPHFRNGLLGHRLTGLALSAREAGSLLLLDTQKEELVALHRDAMVTALRLEGRLVELAEAFLAQGLDMLVLKGPATAHCFYSDPSARPFSDLDLLVRDSQWDRACELLASLGFERPLPEPRPGFDVRFGKAALHRSGTGVNVDLHRTLTPGPFGLWMDPSELFEHTDTLTLGGSALGRLDDTSSLLHACLHASLGWRPPLLLPLRDIVQIARVGSIDWDRLAKWSRDWNLGAVLRHSWSTTVAELGAAPPAGAEHFREAQISVQEQRALDAYTTGMRGRGGMSRATVRAIPGLSGKAAYLSGLLLPRREFLKARTVEGRPSYLRRWTIPGGWLLGGRKHS